MSTSRLTKWIRFALTLLLVSLAICSLMSAARSRGSILTSKASYYTSYDSQNYLYYDSNEWTQDNEYTITGGVHLSSTGASGGRQEYAVTFNGCTEDNADLIFAVVATRRSDGSKYFESAYFPANTKLYVPIYFSAQGESSDIRWKFYIKRADGLPLNKSDMRNKAALIVLFRLFWEVSETAPPQTTAIPQEWLNTSTAAIPSIVDTSTTIVEIPSDYQSIDSQAVDNYLSLPSRVVSLTTYALTLIGRLLALKYVTPMICFGLLVALAGWLFH